MMNFLTIFIQAIVQLGGWSLLFAACLVTYDVITRKLLNISIAGADEISGYIFAISTACAYSYALLTRANIRIDFIYNRFPAKLQRVLDIISMASLAGLFAVIGYFVLGLVSDAIEYGSKSITPLQTPLAIPQTLWTVGLGIAFLTAVALTVMALFALLRAKDDAVKALVGIPSLDEEIQTELQSEETASPAQTRS